MLESAVSLVTFFSLKSSKMTLSIRHIPSRTPVSIVLRSPVVLPSLTRLEIAMLLTRISHAMTRPLEALGSRRWQTIPRRLSATLPRIWVCWAAGKTSRSRLRVVAASLVCMVPITRCPVSAALTAISIVSRSRSSPITMMSGSSRSAPLSAVKKVFVWSPTWRWVTLQPLDCWTTSIGSSTVMMWSWRVSFR